MLFLVNNTKNRHTPNDVCLYVTMTELTIERPPTLPHATQKAVPLNKITPPL